MFDITKVATMTAAEAVEQARRTATFGLTFVYVPEVKDALAKAINLQCRVADVYAEQFDKSVGEFKKTWKLAA